MTVVDSTVPTSVDPLIRALVANLYVHGAVLIEDIAARATRWEFDLSSSAISQFTVTLHDAGFAILNSGLLDRGNSVTWDDLDMVIAVNETGDDGGIPTTSFTARAAGVQKLRHAKGALVWKNVSPHQLVIDEAAKAGMLSIVDPTSAVRTGIQRKWEPGKQDADQESTWDVFARLAGELGFWLFEAAGVVVFGRPSWVVKNSPVHRTWIWPSGGDHELQAVPVCRNSEDSDVVTIEAQILTEFGVQYRPGWSVDFHGVHGFEGTFIVTEVKAAPGEPVATITLSTPVDPTPTGGDTHAPIRVGPGFGDPASGKLSAAQIACYAKDAGFDGAALVTAVAVALAESGGEIAALNDKNEDGSIDYGLWQINSVHGYDSDQLLSDPTYNARAAFEVSGGGTNFAPWVTYNNGKWKSYFQDAIRGAAAPDCSQGTAPTSATVEAFVQKALAQAGDRYVLGAGRTDDPDPDAFDCSGLVYWDAHQFGLDCGGTAYAIWQQCTNAGTIMSVGQAINTRGALLFRIANPNYPSTTGDHVAISLGDGNTIEARGTQYGVGEFGASGRSWTAGGMLPGLA